MSISRRNYLTTSGATLAATALAATAVAATPGQPQGPDVRVTNKPNEPVPVTIQGSAQIDTSSPIPVRDVDRKPQEPVQFSLFVPNQIPYTVPAGKRLVIQFVSGSIGIGPSGGVLATVVLTVGPGSFVHVFPGTPVSYNDGEAGGLGFAFSQSCHIYAGAGATIGAHGGQGVLLVAVNVSGYLEDAD